MSQTDLLATSLKCFPSLHHIVVYIVVYFTVYWQKIYTEHTNIYVFHSWIDVGCAWCATISLWRLARIAEEEKNRNNAQTHIQFHSWSHAKCKHSQTFTCKYIDFTYSVAHVLGGVFFQPQHTKFEQLRVPTSSSSSMCWLKRLIIHVPQVDYTEFTFRNKKIRKFYYYYYHDH